MGVKRSVRSDSGAWKSPRLGEDDDAVGSGDVAFHQILHTERVSSWRFEAMDSRPWDKIIPCI